MLGKPYIYNNIEQLLVEWNRLFDSFVTEILIKVHKRKEKKLSAVKHISETTLQ
jgi:hypothetical protein